MPFDPGGRDRFARLHDPLDHPGACLSRDFGKLAHLPFSGYHGSQFFGQGLDHLSGADEVIAVGFLPAPPLFAVFGETAVFVLVEAQVADFGQGQADCDEGFLPLGDGGFQFGEPIGFVDTHYAGMIFHRWLRLMVSDLVLAGPVGLGKSVTNW